MADHETGETGDALWDEFDRVVGENTAVHEPSAAERAASARRRGRWPIFGVILCCLTAIAGIAALLFWPTPPAKRSASLPVSASPSPGVTPIPLTVFPEQIQGYTRVATAADANCTGLNHVAAPLGEMISQSHGCAGLDLAMYKDADNNRYNLVLFTMNDPMDAIHLVTTLSSNPADYEVAVQPPPADSGLQALPADSGLVQAFSGYDHAMLVGMAQWSDGRNSDYQKLVDKLTPLTNAVMQGLHGSV